MSVWQFNLTCMLAAALGILLMRWVMRRNLPVRYGRLLFWRAYFWWTVSLFVGCLLYFISVLAAADWLGIFTGNLPVNRRDDAVTFGMIVLSIPVIFGFIYGIYVQIRQDIKHAKA